MMIAAIYSRKSKFTGKGDSVENQLQMCKEYATRNLGITEFIEYEDEGFSGKNTNRPSFQQMMKDAKAKKFDTLICYKLDRIARNVGDFSTIIDNLQALGVNFVSLKEQFDTNSPMGRAMMNIAAVFAQLERETIAERVRDNMLELAKNGRWLGGQTPLGFKSEQIVFMDEEYKERIMYKLSPLENELKLVKLIYDKYIEFKSLRKVSTYLLTNSFKTKLGAEWNVKGILDVLTNPTYVKATNEVLEFLSRKGITTVGKANGKNGILTYNKKKGRATYRDVEEWIAAVAKHEGIIEASKWLEIQETLKDNKSKAPRLGKTHNALLTGILRCGKCGSPMTVVHGPVGKNGLKRFYYSCSLKQDSKGTRCDNSNINSLDIESAVIVKLKEYAKDDGLLYKELEDTLDEVCSTNNNVNEKEMLLNSIKEHESAIENLVKQLSENSTSLASKYIILEIEKREKELIDIKKQLESLAVTTNEVKNLKEIINIVKDAFNKFYKHIDDGTNENKKMLICPLVDSITWDSSTGEVDIKLWGSPKKK